MLQHIFSLCDLISTPLGLPDLVSDGGIAAWWWWWNPYYSHIKQIIKISPSKTFNISFGMITHLTYTFVVTDEI
jgi:hypothetical protein